MTWMDGFYDSSGYDDDYDYGYDRNGATYDDYDHDSNSGSYDDCGSGYYGDEDC